jgi:hypothetical protein
VVRQFGHAVTSRESDAGDAHLGQDVRVDIVAACAVRRRYRGVRWSSGLTRKTLGHVFGANRNRTWFTSTEDPRTARTCQFRLLVT